MTPDKELDALVERLLAMHCDEGGAIICHDAVSAISALRKERDHYKFAADSCASFSDVVVAERDLFKKERDEALRELDEASPRQNCARCGKEFRWHRMVAEEGDEWECYPCNERENARERALDPQEPTT